MKRTQLLTLLCLVFCFTSYAQSERKYSAINPALLLYTTADVVVTPPIKHNDGANLIRPNPILYPWEARLENGMPNVVVNPTTKDVTVYLSSFLLFSDVPPSKVGMMAFVNKTSSLDGWTRPNAGLYYYNSQGTTSDQRISPTFSPGFQQTNIVAVDMESAGIFVDRSTSYKPVKLIYLPQRESHNAIVSAYEMDEAFDQNNIYTGFQSMKIDRVAAQKNFTFKFINGDTHMNLFKKNGKYYFVSRLNSKRSSLLDGEILPLKPDHRIRYRRETVSEVGPMLESKNVELGISLDMSTPQWEPYSMQPFQLPGNEDDILWGLVTMFGAEADLIYGLRQRTELAYSNDGVVWRYVKPGTPFLDNSPISTSDDFGTINIAKPVMNTKFSSSPNDLYYFYAASMLRHIHGRNPGISLAVGKAGKYAAIASGEGDAKMFLSMSPKADPIVSVADMPTYNITNAFWLGTDPSPSILSDVKEDPSGKTISQLASFVEVAIFAYNDSQTEGLGALLVGTLGSTVKGTEQPSDDYEKVGLLHEGNDAASKYYPLEYIKQYSRRNPSQIVSFRNFGSVPVVVRTQVKNAKYYGLKFSDAKDAPTFPLDVTASSNFNKGGEWNYVPTTPASPYKLFNFADQKLLPNQRTPSYRTTGAIAVTAQPSTTSNEDQILLRLYSDSENHQGLYYTKQGEFEYRVVKDGIHFSNTIVKPNSGSSFNGKKCYIYVEAVKNGDRIYAKSEFPEESLVVTVKCPDLTFEKSVQQSIIWNWKHAEGQIADSDRANARAFAYLQSSSFVGNPKSLTIGGGLFAPEDKFLGSIFNVTFTDKLR